MSRELPAERGNRVDVELTGKVHDERGRRLTVVDTDVEISRSVVEGPAASALLAAEDADLLVVGSRGRDGFTGLLLGSVSQQCAHHASCPVAIVRGRPAGRRSRLRRAGAAGRCSRLVGAGALALGVAALIGTAPAT